MSVRCPNCRTDVEPAGDRLAGFACPSCGYQLALISAETASFTPPSEVATSSVGNTAPPTTPDRWDVGQRVLDDFVIESKLGEGGMGYVYLLRSTSTGERFAVKRTKHQSPLGRRQFLSELQSWIGLPEYPHFAACRFFRTVADETTIFAEYVAGGALGSWIRDGTLYHGTPDEVLARILDVAIQFAWGLHATHVCGLIHQDVKPGNVLLTPFSK